MASPQTTVSIDWCIALHLATSASWPYVKSELLKVRVAFDLYVNLVENFQWNSAELAAIEDEIRTDFAHCCDHIVVRRRPNVDMDIGGFFSSLVDIYESGRAYKFVFKLHTKSRMDWLQMMLGTVVAAFDHCDAMYRADETIGQFGACNWIFACPDYYDYGCFDAVMNYLDALGYPRMPNQQYGFAGGTIFTMRLSILTRWIERIGGLDTVRRIADHLAQSLSSLIHTRHDHAHDPWLHGAERLFGILVTRSGYSIRGLVSLDHEKNFPHNLVYVANVYVDKPLLIGLPLRSALPPHDPVQATEMCAPANFDAVSYLMENPDVMAFAFLQSHKATPLIQAAQHWVLFGRAEKRRVLPNVDHL